MPPGVHDARPSSRRSGRPPHSTTRGAAADPISAPGSAWGDGEGRNFELLWNGSQAVFSVDNVGTSVYTSLDDCCSDVFQRVRDLNKGSSLTFSNLVLNWGYKINTVFTDDLDFSLLKANGFDNLVSLTGIVTLNLSPDSGRQPFLNFDGSPVDEMPMSANGFRSVPEPGLLLLIGSGLVGVSTMARRRLRAAQSTAEPPVR